MKFKKEFEYILSESFKYSHEGQHLDAKRLLLRAPSAKYLELIGEIQGMYMSAMIKISGMINSSKREKDNTNQEDTSKKSKDDDGSTTFGLVLSGMNGEEIKKFNQSFIKLFTTEDICLIDGKEKMTDSLLQEMHYKEVQNIMGEYIKNFLS
jgi:hypothetical protein